MRAALIMAIAAAFALMLSTTARAATITVNSLADPGRAGICALRDAITAANTKRTTHGCAAGTDNDTIQFRVTGTITLASTLPKVTDRQLTITGPITGPGHITISGGGTVQVMQVALGSKLNLMRLTIANGNNLSTGLGGGIGNEGTLALYNTSFTNNNTDGAGGAIYNIGTLTVTNSTFLGNNADGSGGITNEGMLTVTNSTFSENFATISGGAIGNRGTLTVTNSTFFGNSTDFDGGIENIGSASLKSTIMAAGGCSGTITDAGYNISDDPSCGFRATGSHNNTNPMLDPRGPRNNGGPTQTIALLSGSPAIDAIPVADCTNQASPPHRITTDQRGFPRPDAGETNCDIGAYESSF